MLHAPSSSLTPTASCTDTQAAIALARPRHAVSLANALVALLAKAPELSPQQTAEVASLRQALLQTGVPLRGQAPPIPPPGLPLAPATAAVLGLCGDADAVMALRAWASLVAVSRWSLEQQGQSVNASTFFGAVKCGGSGRNAVQLVLPGSKAPLTLPMLDLLTYDWRHRPNLADDDAHEALLDVGAVWQHLKPEAENLVMYGEMAVNLIRIAQRGQVASPKRERVFAAAQALNKIAGSPHLLEAPWAAAVEAQAPKLDTKEATPCPGAPATCAPIHTPSPCSPPNQPASGAPPEPVAVAALSAALEALKTPAKPVTYAAVAGATAATVVVPLATRCPSAASTASNSGASTPTLKSFTLLSRTGSTKEGPTPIGSPLEAWVDAAEELGDAWPPPPGLEEVLLAKPNLEEAWQVLATAARDEANKLSEGLVRRLLASPPEGALTPQAERQVAVWLRRIAAQPSQAADFVEHDAEALRQWCKMPALSSALGRLFAAVSVVHAPRPAALLWMEVAAKHDGGAPLLQTLREVGLGHPLLQEALSFVSFTSAQLSAFDLTQLIAVLSQKLGSKKSVPAALRDNFEQALAGILSEAQSGYDGLDFDKAYAWRIMGHGSLLHRGAALEVALSQLSRPQAASAGQPARVLQRVGQLASIELQLMAAVPLLQRNPDDLALAQTFAAHLQRNKKLFTQGPQITGIFVEPQSVIKVLSLCIVAEETWSGKTRASAEAMWQGLEHVGFFIPYLIGQQNFRGAAALMYHAFGNQHLRPKAFFTAIFQQTPAVKQKLIDALQVQMVKDQTRLTSTTTDLQARANKALLTKQRDNYLAISNDLMSRTSRSIYACRTWIAAASTAATVDYGETVPFVSFGLTGGAPASHELQVLLTFMAQRQQHSVWQPFEQATRALVVCLRDQPQLWTPLFDYLRHGIENDTALWGHNCLSVAVADSLLKAVAPQALRHKMAVDFGTAYRLWPVSLLHESSPATEVAEIKSLSLPRADAAQMLLKELLQRREDGAELNPVAANLLRSRLNAGVIHAFRDEEQRHWRVLYLLQLATEGGCLAPADIVAATRSGLQGALSESMAQTQARERTDALKSALQLCCALYDLYPDNLPLLLAPIDAIADVYDKTGHKQALYGGLIGLIKALKQDGETPAEKKLREVMERRAWERTLRAGVVMGGIPQTEWFQTLLAKHSQLPAPALHVCLHTWLDVEELDALPQRYATLARHFEAHKPVDFAKQVHVQAALARVAMACMDHRVRSMILAAMATHGTKVPELNQAILSVVDQLSPFGHSERKQLQRIAGAAPLFAAS